MLHELHHLGRSPTRGQLPRPLQRCCCPLIRSYINNWLDILMRCGDRYRVISANISAGPTALTSLPGIN